MHKDLFSFFGTLLSHHQNSKESCSFLLCEEWRFLFVF
ncbi:hypothetical protein Chls_480 [Chlamydia suis]|uniref:Uncharacterized protein n=1 Tax=Chlamydia suis TaxID=83559 RepID=A0ABX6IQF8_9CHLA|nr:hypothetical protein Chls_480 [Chlamydia suis]